MRKLRGICFIDPEDKEFKGMPCKIMKKNSGSCGLNNIKKQDLRVFWKLMNLHDFVWENHYSNHHEDHITAPQFGSQIYSYASRYEKSCSKSSGGQGMGEIGENFGMEPDKSQKQEK